MYIFINEDTREVQDMMEEDISLGLSRDRGIRCTAVLCSYCGLLLLETDSFTQHFIFQCL